MKYYPVEQGSMEWHNLRLGRPTASEFSNIITPAKGDYSKSARKYIAQLIQETRIPFLPEHAELFTTRSMKWGKAMEREARDWYAMETGYKLLPGGFITTDDGRFGCSPDSLIEINGVIVGGLELKCTDPGFYPGEQNVHTEWLLEGGLPLAHKCQVHGCLAVSGLQWWEFLAYPPPAKDPENALPALRVRVVPDKFTDEMRVCMEMFHADLTKATARIQSM